METEAFFEKIEKIKMPIRLLILFGTVIIFTGLFAYSVYIPKTTEIKQTKEEIDSLNQKLRRAKIKSKDKATLLAEKEQVDIELKEALKLLPNTKEIPKLLRKVTELGNASNLDFRIFRPKKEKSREFYVEIPVSIEVRGTYHSGGHGLSFAFFEQDVTNVPVFHIGNPRKIITARAADIKDNPGRVCQFKCCIRRRPGTDDLYNGFGWHGAYF